MYEQPRGNFLGGLDTPSGMCTQGRPVKTLLFLSFAACAPALPTFLEITLPPLKCIRNIKKKKVFSSSRQWRARRERNNV